jgi:hypothetical protein
MVRLVKTLNAWRTPQFRVVLQKEIEALDATLLPLQQGLAQGGYANGDSVSAMFISASEERGAICVRVGVFYTSIIAGCSCADDPTPIDECSEYCEVQFKIDKITADTKVSLLTD